MRYRVTMNDPGQSSVMAEVIEVEADGPPDLTSNPEFVVFSRAGAQVALFRRELVQAMYEASGRQDA
ncbi:MAG TPA: hypothetical protein VII66_10645 [Gemmatimonadaceae bacterium]